MEKITENQINELFLDAQNRSCFECGGHVTHWVSANNAVFLCLSCAGIHRGFGPDISFVRSLKMDSWTPSQFEAMKRGGNAKLREYFASLNISFDGAMDAKYKTDAAHQYRNQLKASDQEKPFSPDSSLGEEQIQKDSPTQTEDPTDHQDHDDHCHETNQDSHLAEPEVVVEDDLQSPTKSKQKFDSTKLANTVQQGFKKFGESVAGGAKSVAAGTKVAATKINQKMKESHIKQDAKVFGNKVANAAKKSYIGAIGYFKKLSTKKKNQDLCETNCDENTDEATIQEQINQYKKALAMYDQEKPSLSL